ncbi:MAG: hypothetical protein U0802_15255 [Candidatus Binatia bacterium]
MTAGAQVLPSTEILTVRDRSTGAVVAGAARRRPTPSPPPRRGRVPRSRRGTRLGAQRERSACAGRER